MQSNISNKGENSENSWSIQLSSKQDSTVKYWQAASGISKARTYKMIHLSKDFKWIDS